MVLGTFSDPLNYVLTLGFRKQHRFWFQQRVQRYWSEKNCKHYVATTYSAFSDSKLQSLCRLYTFKMKHTWGNICTSDCVIWQSIWVCIGANFRNRCMRLKSVIYENALQRHVRADIRMPWRTVLGLYSLNGRESCRKISRSVEAGALAL